MKRIADLWWQCSRGVAEAVFPSRCRLCDDWREAGKLPFCTPCHHQLVAERAWAYCLRCGANVERFEVAQGQCRRCRNHQLRVLGTARLSSWRDTNGRITHTGRLLRSFKYRAREEMGPELGTWLGEAIGDCLWRDRIDAIVPVPTAWHRRWTRPHYPPAVLAEVVSDHLDVPVVNALRRVESRSHQIGLSFSQRRANVAGAFSLVRGISMDKSRLLLIDDVRTTGATLEECAKMLKRGGAGELYAGVVVVAGARQSAGFPIGSP